MVTGADPDARAAVDGDKIVAELEKNIQNLIDARKVAEAESTDPGGGEARDGDVCPSPLPLVVAGSETVPVEPPKPTPAPQQTSPQPPLLPPDAPIPAAYLKGPPEPWRPYVSEYGISTTPWRR